MTRKYEYVFWDWNGTLFDDIGISLKTINNCLTNHGLEPLTLDKYYGLFCFPIEKYYRNLGFDFSRNSYEDLAAEYMRYYQLFSPEAKLSRNVSKVVGKLYLSGVKQYILSASEKQILINDLDRFGLKPFFTDIIAMDNIYGTGKKDLAREYLKEHPLQGKALMVGDTSHDYELSRDLGMDCALITGGHGKKEELLSLENALVIDDFIDLLPFVFGEDELFRNKNVSHRNPDDEERRNKDLREAAKKSLEQFTNNYYAYYDDVKNRTITEDW